MSNKPFYFKKFCIEQNRCTMKIGTDGVLLGAWFDVEGANRILDIGTGTGLIAIMAAQRNANAQVIGVEIEQASYEQAVANAKASPWQDRIDIEHMAIQDFSKNTSLTFERIVCNPPFFTGGTLSENNARAAVRHTIKLPTGDLLSSSRRLLAKDGQLAVILPYLEGLRFEEQAAHYGFYTVRKTLVRPKKEKPFERILLELSLQEQTCIENELIIQFEARNDYTPDYVKLTQAFYLKM